MPNLRRFLALVFCRDNQMTINLENNCVIVISHIKSLKKSEEISNTLALLSTISYKYFIGTTIP